MEAVVPLAASSPNDTGAPRPPKGLSRASRRLWEDAIEQFDGWDAVKLSLLAIGCGAVDRSQECRVVIAREGMTIAGSRGDCVRAHPLIKVQRDAERTALEAFTKLGITR